MTTNLAFGLEGAHRHNLLTNQQLIELDEQLVERVQVLAEGLETIRE
ncbi:hypothetical protein PS619_00454 [Pseudomonas fluorescens]|nr:hypothetical protein PS619_00454 [Pseudomonas fluorescens]